MIVLNTADKKRKELWFKLHSPCRCPHIKKQQQLCITCFLERMISTCGLRFWKRFYMYQEALESGHHNGPWNRHAKPCRPADTKIDAVTIKGPVKVRSISPCWTLLHPPLLHKHPAIQWDYRQHNGEKQLAVACRKSPYLQPLHFTCPIPLTLCKAFSRSRHPSYKNEIIRHLSVKCGSSTPFR